MKRLLGLLLVMGMVGCGGEGEAPPVGLSPLPATPNKPQAKADESGLIGSWQGGPQGEFESRWTFNEDGTGNTGFFGALAPSTPFTWESAGADRVTLTLAAPNGQSQKTIATWAVSGDTLTFTREGAPEKLVLKRASAQSAPKHPEYLAHTWKSHPVLSNGLKQTAVFAKTGVLTLTTENGKPVQGTWEATGNQLTLSYPDTDSGELQTLVYQMTMGGADEEGTDTPILERLRDDVIQKNIDTIGRDNFPDNPNNTWAIRKTTHEGDLAYVEVIPSPQDVGYPSFIFVLDFRETTEGRFIGAYCMENGKYSLLFTESNVDATAVQAAVAALKKLGAKIKRNDNGEVVTVRLRMVRRNGPQVTDLVTSADLYLQGVGENKVSLMYTRPLHQQNGEDAGLVHLKEMANLQELELSGTQVTDKGLVHLKGMIKLQKLRLHRNKKITGAGLVHLKGLAKLQTLSLHDTQVTDAGLGHLAGMNLKQLSIPVQAQTDIGLKHYLAAIEPSSRLYLKDWQITDAGLVHIKGMTNLKTLDLRDTKVTDAGLVHLKGMTNLQTLYLSATQVTDAGLVHLKGLTKLQTLSLQK